MGPTAINSLTLLLQHIGLVLEKRSDQILKQKLGIGLSQYKILMALEWNPRVDQQTLASTLGQTEASVSRQISNLLRKDLVHVLSKTSKRGKVTALTPAGMKITEEAASLLKSLYGVDFSSLGNEAISELNLTLRRLHKTLCQPGKAGSCDHRLNF